MLLTPSTTDLAHATINERLRVAENARLTRTARNADQATPGPATSRENHPSTEHPVAALQLLLTLAVIALVVAGSVTTVLLETAGGKFP